MALMRTATARWAAVITDYFLTFNCQSNWICCCCCIHGLSPRFVACVYAPLDPLAYQLIPSLRWLVETPRCFCATKPTYRFSLNSFIFYATYMLASNNKIYIYSKVGQTLLTVSEKASTSHSFWWSQQVFTWLAGWLASWQGRGLLPAHIFAWLWMII